MNTRREFLVNAPLGLLGVAAVYTQEPQNPASPSSPAPSAPPGAPPTFGTAPVAGPAVSPETFAEAEKLVQVTMSPAERETAARSWRTSMASMLERRTGPRMIALEDTLAPASRWNPSIGAEYPGPARDAFIRTPADPGALPATEDAIAFATVTQLSGWIERKAITSERLTRIYLDRLERFDPRLRCVITLTRDLAIAQATQADAEIAAGKYRGPLHGIPYGVKDLLDTANIPTTYGAEPFRNRVPAADSFVVRRLTEAGAVLVAKLSLGALALNDIWFGGQTMNPWLMEEGASGSSAGPGAATAAGLVAFSIGSETGGSIVSPAMRCGITGLRPTFGRVARTGAMTLCWSLDKLGPDDAERRGRDAGPAGDLRSGCRRCLERAEPHGLRRDGRRRGPARRVHPPLAGGAAGNGHRSLGARRREGARHGRTEVTLPDWPYSSLMPILFAEGAAAFEELTLSGQAAQLKVQVPDAWPNLFREARFLSAVDFVQADRLRRKVAIEMARIFSQVDLLLVPSLRDEMLTISNFTGHPSLTLRAGFVQVSQARSDWAPDPAHPLPRFSPPRRVPHGVTLLGRLFDEGTVARAGLALERRFGVAGERPPGF